MTELKACPFCGGDAESFKYIESGGGEYSSSQSMFRIRCKECWGCMTKRATAFCDVSKYTVQDFRDDPTLRPIVTKQHEAILAKEQQDLADLWNTRVEVQP